MEWRDQGTVLAVRKYGESSVIVEVFTEAHGRHAGVVRGGVSRKMTPHLQPGGQISVTWKARLEDHLGSFTVEPLRSRAADVMGDPLALEGLNTLTALLTSTLPEREPHDYLYVETISLFDRLGVDPDWPLAYLHWEVSLLEELGFGLDLSACAVTGSPDDLAYVSPQIGACREPSGGGRVGGPDAAAAAMPAWPIVLVYAEIIDGMTTTGHFIAKILAELSDKPLPQARARFLDRLAKKAAQEAPPF